VVTTRDSDEFVRLFADQVFDAVVMGDSIDLDERARLAAGCRKSKPHVPLIIFFRTPGEAQQLLPYAHSLVASLDGPERLLAAVQAAVSQAGRKPPRRPEA
jgi:hypothetical protein